MVMHCYLPPQLPMIFQFQRKNGRFSTFNRLINVRTESGLNNKITHFLTSFQCWFPRWNVLKTWKLTHMLGLQSRKTRKYEKLKFSWRFWKIVALGTSWYHCLLLLVLFFIRVIFYNQQNEGTSRRRRSPVAIKTYPRKSFRNPYKSSVILNV